MTKNFRLRSTTGSSILSHDFGHLCRGSTTWKSRNNVRDFYSSYLRRRQALFGRNCVSSESSSTRSTWSTTLPMYFCSFGSNSAFFDLTDVHQCSKVDFLLASRINSLSLLTIPKSHAEIVSSFFLSLSTAAFQSRIFIACGIGRNLGTKLWCVMEGNPFTTMRSPCVLDCKDSASCLVDTWDSTKQQCTVWDSFTLPFFGSAFAFTMQGCCLSILLQVSDKC